MPHREVRRLESGRWRSSRASEQARRADGGGIRKSALARPLDQSTFQFSTTSPWSMIDVRRRRTSTPHGCRGCLHIDLNALPGAKYWIGPDAWYRVSSICRLLNLYRSQSHATIKIRGASQATWDLLWWLLYRWHFAVPLMYTIFMENNLVLQCTCTLVVRPTKTAARFQPHGRAPTAQGDDDDGAWGTHRSPSRGSTVCLEYVVWWNILVGISQTVIVCKPYFSRTTM